MLSPSPSARLLTQFLVLGIAIILALPAATRPAYAAAVTVIHDFNPGVVPDQPIGPLVEYGGNFYGTSKYGVPNSSNFQGYGTIFKTTPAGVTTILHTFNGSGGQMANGGLVIGSDNNLYGASYSTFFSITPSGTFTVLHQLYWSTEGGGCDGLIKGLDGNFYAVCEFGGANSDGTIDKIGVDGSVTVLYTFANSTDGITPVGKLAQDTDGNLYGATAYGGANGGGTLFKLDTSNTLTTIDAFSSVTGDGYKPTGNLLLASDGKLYGYTQSAGTAAQGTMFQCATSGTLSTLYNFGAGPNPYYSPQGAPLEASPGDLYVVCQSGGASPYHGGVLQVTTAGAVSTVHDVGASEGWSPNGGLIVGDDGALYGVNSSGNASVGGVYNVTTGGAYTSIASFGYSEGAYPNMNLMKSPVDGSYYGVTQFGGSGYRGTAFRVSSTGVYSTLHSFTGAEGRFPSSPLVQEPGGPIYGALPSAGPNGYGDLFSMTANGSLTDILDFSNSTYFLNPYLIASPDGNYYGILSDGGAFFCGAVLKIASGVVTDLADLPSSLASGLSANEMVDGGDGYLYVVNNGGGANNKGAIFRLLKSTGDVALLYSFDGTNGQFPNAALILGADGYLYGTTPGGVGPTANGTVYKIARTDPFAVTLVHAFANSEGIQPYSPLVQDPSTGIFYGTCRFGGANAKGTIFSMTADGTVTKLYDFDGTAGQTPYAALLQIDSVSFMGATSAGGAHEAGTVFKFTLRPPAPTGLTATGHVGSISLAWNPVPSADTFNVYRGSTAGGESATPIVTGLTSPSYSDPSIPNGTTYYYKVAGVNSLGTGAMSTEAHASTPSATVSFVSADTSTQGNWKGVYGADGWNVIGDTSRINPTTPSYVTTSATAHNTGLWAATSLAPAALQMSAAGSGARTVGVWYQTCWFFFVYMNAAHQVTLYLVDLNHAGYAETLTVKDAVTGIVLDTETASTFSGGVYYAWNVNGNVNVTLTSTAGHWAVVNGIFFGGTGPTAPATPSILGAATGNNQLKLTWSASSGATSYNVYRGTTAGGESTTPVAAGITSTTYTDTALTTGSTYYYKLIAVNAVGGSFASTEASGTVSTTSAAFVKADAGTQGNWKGNYGADGWNVIGDANTQAPAYGAFTPGAHTSGVWAASTLSPAALQTAAAASSGREAGVWFNTTWTSNVNVTGTHQIALYLLDINNAGYAETITLKDAATGAVLDTRTASSFQTGVYYVWNVSGNVNVTLTSTAGHWAVVSGIFFGGGGAKAPVAPINPVASASNATQIGLTWTASTGATSYNVYRGTVAGAESATPIATSVTVPHYTDTGLMPGTAYYYKLVAVNAVGGSFASAEASATTLTPTSTATFVATDTSTQGSWKGNYGLDGYNVIGDTSGANPVYPNYATVSAGTHTAGIWAASTSSVAALQKVASGSTDRIAGVWFNTTWSMNVNVAPSAPNNGGTRLALYFLDYPNAGYAETITIKDAATGYVLDTRSISAFQAGKYLVWNVSGNVTVTLTSTAGHWAPISGLFLG